MPQTNQCSIETHACVKLLELTNKIGRRNKQIEYLRQAVKERDQRILELMEGK